MSFMTLHVSDRQDWFIPEDGDIIPAEYAEPGDAGTIERDMFGCQYSASGYMDQTSWCIARTAIEAVRDCVSTYGDDMLIKGEDDDERNDLAWAYRYARSLDRAARKANA